MTALICIVICNVGCLGITEWHKWNIIERTYLRDIESAKQHKYTPMKGSWFLLIIDYVHRIWYPDFNGGHFESNMAAILKSNMAANMHLQLVPLDSLPPKQYVEATSKSKG